MNYKKEVTKLLTKFPALKPREMIKLNRYFVEYARGLAEQNGLDTVKEYKRTSKVIQLYAAKGYECLGDVWAILDMYDQIAKTQTQYDDSDTMISMIATSEEMDEIKCLIEILEQ